MTIKEVIAQKWLNGIPNKGIIKSIGRTQAGVRKEEFWGLADDEVLKGELKITDFPELKLVRLRSLDDTDGKGLLSKVIIKNCPKLENVNLINNEITELDVSGLSNLNYLLATDNKLGKVNVEGCVNLQWVMVFNSEESAKEEWKGLEDLKRLAFIHTDDPFFPAKEFKNWKAITDPNKGLDILNSGGVIDDNKLKEYKEWNNKFPGETAEKVAQRINAWESLAERMVKELESFDQKGWRNEFEACQKK